MAPFSSGNSVSIASKVRSQIRINIRLHFFLFLLTSLS